MKNAIDALARDASEFTSWPVQCSDEKFFGFLNEMTAIKAEMGEVARQNKRGSYKALNGLITVSAKVALFIPPTQPEWTKIMTVVRTDSAAGPSAPPPQ